MIVILKLAFCLRAIGVKICEKTTAETPEGKREGHGVSPPAQRHVTKSVTSPSAQKVMWQCSCEKLFFYCTKSRYTELLSSVTLTFAARKGDFLSRMNAVAIKAVVREKRSFYILVIWKI